MYKHILVAVDGSEAAGHAFAHATALARAVGARITGVLVTEMWTALEMVGEVRRHVEHPVEEFEKRETSFADKILAAAADAAKGAGLQYESVHVRDSRVADGIVKTATARGCDLIVMGSHGRHGVNQMLVGSSVDKVLAHSKIPVLVHR